MVVVIGIVISSTSTDSTSTHLWRGRRASV